MGDFGTSRSVAVTRGLIMPRQSVSRKTRAAETSFSSANKMTGDIGTLEWMAPEVLDNREYGLPADVYRFVH